jgi:trk system potassium uptake protein TrkH
MIEADLNFSQAVFEATSAWTTTGLSVVDVESASPLILFYRSLLQLAGGAGLAIITMSAIAGPIGYGLSIAEGRGEQLAPHIRDSTNIVLSLYAGYVIFGIGALYVTGMSLFDAVNHSFSALSTGGFSTRVASIGYWDNPGVEAATILLMLLGTINFLTAYTLLRGRFRAVFKNGELRLMVALSALVVPSLFFIVTHDLYTSAGKALRVAIFETISAMSTTGFSTVGYTDWPDFGWLMLALLMIIGGGTGSTAGGIKQYRIYILYKAIIWELRKSFMPAHMVNEPAVWRGDRRQLLSDYQVRQVALFIGLYGTVFVLGSAIMTAYGYSLHETFFEFASSLGTVGLSVGVTAPDMPFAVMWTQIVAMVLGRLEFFAVLVGIFKLMGDCRVMFSR